MSTFDETDVPSSRDEPGTPDHGGDGPGLADSDLNSERADGSGGEGTSATTTGESSGDPAGAQHASGEDAARGNLDGSAAHADPRADALDAAQEGTADALADQAGTERESGQDNGLNE